jgi:hypothetical protein
MGRASWLCDPRVDAGRQNSRLCAFARGTDEVRFLARRLRSGPAFARVLLQQGRVLTDADFKEQAAI